MDFLYEVGYEVRFTKVEEFQAWVIAHQDEMKRAMPAGVEYLGSYALVFGNGYEGGAYRDLLRLDSYGALDRIAEVGKNPDSAYSRLMREMSQFVDMTQHPVQWTQILLKNVVDATSMNMPAAEERALVGAARS